jgi:phospholipase C
MQENRSFDHYLGQLHAFGEADTEPEPPTGNPNPNGGTLPPFHQERYCEVADLDHSWTGTHRSWDNGKMDGFATVNVAPEDANGSRTLGYYNQDDLPYYYDLFDRFAIGDRYFASVMGPTYPNRFYLVAGTSFGHISNDLPTGPSEFATPTIFNLLDAAGITWKVYQQQFAWVLLFAYVRDHDSSRVVPVAQYFEDIAAGTLPQVVFIDLEGDASPNTELDEHPPSNIQVGQAYVARVIAALTSSTVWNSSALFLTYDEHGGYYDHVPPSPACLPDSIPPMLAPDDMPGSFDRYGIRVPLAVISPFARPHFVSHVTYDHTSILRFIETRFDLPALTARDANADPMLDMFDFQNPEFLQPPSLAAAEIDAAHMDQCAQ